MEILKAPDKKKNGKVACVGAGPASLACAAELAKEGYRVTIFEKHEKPGGVLTYGITPSRLPRAVVDHDIAQVKKLGVKFVLNTEVGKDVNLEDMDFDAIFVGVGLWGSRVPDIKGVELKGVYKAIDFLKEAAEKKKDFDPGKAVIVVGGGDVAIDCAVTAKLLGGGDVKIVYRRTLEEAPSNMDEWHYAMSLGIGVTTNMAPAELLGKGKNVEYAMFTGRDKKSELKLACDTVVFAIGQEPYNVDKIADVKLNEKGGIAAKATGKTNVAKIFAAGDIVNNGKTVVEAVAEGKEAAASIIKYLEKKGVK
jgi:dihydropyrimidine dehydrogenase (NAD+) subunit PreT